MFRKFLKDKKGATAIEYGLIAAMIAVAAIGGMTTLGSNNTVKMTLIANEMSKKSP